MISRIGFVLVSVVLLSCSVKTRHEETGKSMPIVGTWRLLSGTLIEKGDTVVTDYTKDLSFIKIINDSHFAFFSHDLKNGKDSLDVFSAGSGTYVLVDSTYTEHLEYCSAREWENHDFKFTLTLKNDTLVQQGIEVIEDAGVNRLNIEKYVRMKN
jgi:hypothetical protein